MPRQTKQKVDYFPHYVKHGKTMAIIEQRYGNDGYAFWFKLLELLGDTEGHCFRGGNPADMAYLGSLSHIDVVTVTEILDLLAMLGAIDAELWADKVVWCQHFVDGLDPVYSKRVTEMPVKPDSLAGNDAGGGFPGPDIPKVKESKVERKEEGPLKALPPDKDKDSSKRCERGHRHFGTFCPDCYREDRAAEKEADDDDF